MIQSGRGLNELDALLSRLFLRECSWSYPYGLLVTMAAVAIEMRFSSVMGKLFFFSENI
jgi:hypothetical protein